VRMRENKLRQVLRRKGPAGIIFGKFRSNGKQGRMEHRRFNTHFPARNPLF